MGQANKTPAPFSFMRSNLISIFVFALALIMIPPSIWAQAGAATGSAIEPPFVQSAFAQRSSSEKALRMAESGRFKEALPLLKIAAQERSDKESQRRTGILAGGC